MNKHITEQMAPTILLDKYKTPYPTIWRITVMDQYQWNTDREWP